MKTIITLLFFTGYTIAGISQTNFVKYTGNPILPLGAPGEWDDECAFVGHLIYTDSLYQMWYSGNGNPSRNTLRIGYATSIDGLHWQKNENNPVVTTTPGDWDSDVVGWQSVVFNGEYYEMWYTNYEINYRFRFGYATSSDGINWTKYEGNPIFEKGAPGEWDDYSVAIPYVVRTDTLYQMWYTGSRQDGIWQTGYATSKDGINWTRHPENPILPSGKQGDWDYGMAAGRNCFYENGLYYMYYCGNSKPFHNFYDMSFGLATSVDGIHWTKHPDNPILEQGSSGDWDKDGLWIGQVFKEGHRYRMWYTGRLLPNPDEHFGYAEDFSNAAHVDSVKVYPDNAIGGQNLWIGSYIANPHDEELTANAIILSNDGSIKDTVILSDGGDNHWTGNWFIPNEDHKYSIGVEVNNLSADYIHKSLDWNVFELFSVHSTTHNFTKIAHVNDGPVYNVTVSLDGTVFCAGGEDGLRAYSLIGDSLINTAHENDGDEYSYAVSVAVSPDNTVFLANGQDGLRAYNYDGSSFTLKAHINDNEDAIARDVALSPDGTVFLANGKDGMRVYNFNGISFKNTAHINDGGTALGVMVSSDNTVFVANGKDGLRAYSYYGDSIINTAHINDIDGTPDSGLATDVAVSFGNIIFLANGDAGLWAYHYDGRSFNNTAHVNDYGTAQGIDIASDGTIFLANGGWIGNDDWGIWAYIYDNDSLINTAVVDKEGNEYDVAVDSKGNVYGAYGNGGLYVYKYTPFTPTSIDNVISEIPDNNLLEQNYPNPFHSKTTIAYNMLVSEKVKLAVYDIFGREIDVLVNEKKGAGKHENKWNSGDLPSGIYMYRLFINGQSVETKKMIVHK